MEDHGVLGRRPDYGKSWNSTWWPAVNRQEGTGYCREIRRIVDLGRRGSGPHECKLTLSWSTSRRSLPLGAADGAPRVSSRARKRSTTLAMEHSVGGAKHCLLLHRRRCRRAQSSHLSAQNKQLVSSAMQQKRPNMEDTRTQGPRRWTAVSKASIVGGSIGASVTLLMVLLNRLDLGLPPHGLSDWLFPLAVVVLHGLAGVAGLPNGAAAWKWDALSVLLNTLFCCIVGTILGFVVATLRRKAE